MTSTEFVEDGIRYVPSRIAAKTVDLTADYISRMCREGLVAATWHHGQWYVHEPSLTRFLEEKRTRQDALAREQAEKLKREREEAETAARKAHGIATWRRRAHPIALATITLLIATSATALGLPALEHLSLQLPSNTKAQLASAAACLTTLRNLASNISSSITNTISNFLRPVQSLPAEPNS